jgi:dUTP pyrophosphatase
MQNNSPIKIPITGQSFWRPTYQTSGAAGMDMYAANAETIHIKVGARALVPCGFSLAIPEGYEGQIRPRSGLANGFGVTVLNAPGTIDSDYRGEVRVLLINHGADPYEVVLGMRIAQLVIAPVSRVAWTATEELPDTNRGTGGFGHTGT